MVFQSPKKVNLVAALVRGMLVKDALMQLELTIKRAAKTVYQVVGSNTRYFSLSPHWTSLQNL